MKRKFLDIDKSKFDFLLERMDKKYSYDDLQVIVEEKKLLNEAPGGVKSFTNALRYLSNGDNAATLLKAGISKNDLSELVDAAKILKNMSEGDLKQLGSVELLNMKTITHALEALGKKIPNVTKFTNEILESLEVSTAVNTAIKKRFSGDDTNAILELMISKGDTFRSVDDLINQVKSVDQKFPGLIDGGLPAGKKLKDAPGDVELTVLKNSIAPDGMPVLSLPKEVQGLIRKKIKDYGVKETKVPKTISDGIEGGIPDDSLILISDDGKKIAFLPRMKKFLTKKRINLGDNSYSIIDPFKPIQSAKMWLDVVKLYRVGKVAGGYEGILKHRAIRIMINNLGPSAWIAMFLPFPPLVMANFLECVYRIYLEEYSNDLTSVDVGGDETVEVRKLNVGDCLTGLPFGDELKNPMWVPFWKSVPIIAVVSTLMKVGEVVGLGWSDIFSNPTKTFVSGLQKNVNKAMSDIYSKMPIKELLDATCDETTLKSIIENQNELGKNFLAELKPGESKLDIWSLLTKITMGQNPLSKVDDEKVYKFFGAVTDGQQKAQDNWDNIQTYLPNDMKGDINKFNTRTYIMYKCQVARINAIGKWLKSQDSQLKKNDFNDCSLVEFWKKLSTASGTSNPADKVSVDILKSNQQQFMKIKKMIEKDGEIDFSASNTIFDENIWNNVVDNWKFMETYDEDTEKFKNCTEHTNFLDDDEIDVSIVIEPVPTIVLKPEYVPPNYNWEYLTKIKVIMACSKIKLGISMADYEYVTIHQKNYDMPAEERTWNDGVPSYPTIGPAGINLLSDPKYSDYCKNIEGGKTVAQCKASLTKFINTLSC